MLDIQVTPSLAAMQRLFDGMRRNQMPFAIALALTWTAGDARDHLRATLPQHFTIRGTWLARQIQREKARKSQAPPTAIVGVLGGARGAPWMHLHVLGGERPDGAVPAGARPTKRSKTTRSRWPGKIASKPRAFFSELDSGNTGLFEMRGAVPKLMYVFADKVEVKVSWPMPALVGEAAQRHFPERFADAFTEAMRTARPRPER